ncbi:MAG: antitoxin [Actinomycetota bacterium]|jgi:hypothetical protein|nr:antitoxin [Actinomycetota bacterium]
MRTTIDLPDNLHRIAISLARDSRRSLSATVADLIRRGLRADGRAACDPSERAGFPLLEIDRTITSEDIRALDDE